MTRRPVLTVRLAAAVAGLLAMCGTAWASAGPANVPAPVAEIAATLEAQGYTQVRVTERIFGGYVVEGRKGADFALIILQEDGRTLDHTELFRDADNNGIFAQDETTGPAAQAGLRSLVTATLAKPATAAGRKADGETNENIGFAQQGTTLFAPRGLRLDASERLGSGGLAILDSTERRDIDAEGVQRRATFTTQTRTLSTFGSLSLSASTALPGGPAGSFAPISIPGVDSETRTEMANSIRSTVTATAPDATALKAAILSTAPSADAIRAGITPPTPPVAP